jgi:uncharacterized damage-inducible protein DinB
MPATAQPELVERLRGTPARLEERTSGLMAEVITRRPGEAWSIAEHAGHLADLEPLWLGRVDDLLAGEERLRPADLQNRATWEANHNARPLAEILAEFRRRRASLIERLEGLSETELRASALHPRLEQPMTIVDLCFFVAEHDDHHLTTIRALR